MHSVICLISPALGNHAVASALFITVRETPVELPLVCRYYLTDGSGGLEKSTKQQRRERKQAKEKKGNKQDKMEEMSE